jgi:hypothetical protein
MVRQVVAASGTLIVLAAFPMAPHAAAADTDQTVLTQSKIRCLVSADNVARGGGPMVVCQRLDGQPWGASTWSTEKHSVARNLAVERGTGEFVWDKGSISASGAPADQDIIINPGQTYHINGWTIQADDYRTRFTYDGTGHGMFINAADVHQF